MLDKKKLFSKGLKRRIVELPELGEGESVCVQELYGDARDEYDKSLWEQRRNSVRLKLDHATARLVALSCVDEETGERIFGDDEILDLSRKVGASILKKIAEVAKELSGITDDEIEDLTEAKK